MCSWKVLKKKETLNKQMNKILSLERKTYKIISKTNENEARMKEMTNKQMNKIKQTKNE